MPVYLFKLCKSILNVSQTATTSSSGWVRKMARCDKPIFPRPTRAMRIVNFPSMLRTDRTVQYLCACDAVEQNLGRRYENDAVSFHHFVIALGAVKSPQVSAWNEKNGPRSHRCLRSPSP